MKVFNHLLLAGIIGVLLLSCDDELTFSGYDPFVKAKFINADSLSTLETAIAGLKSNIAFLDDSIAVVDSLKEAGDTTANYSVIKDTLNSKRTSLNEEVRSLNAIITDINSGSVLISALNGAGGKTSLNYRDSATSYRLPLNINATRCQFIITIDGQQHEAEFSYDTLLLTTEGAAQIQAFNLQLISSTFMDSSRLVCGNDNRNCISDDATAIFYF